MQAVECADFTDRRDAVAEPQLVDVFGRRHVADDALIGVGEVGVRVDEARQHIHAGRIDLVVAFLGTALFLDWDLRIPDAGDPDDSILLDHDVDRPERRRTGPVDECRAANHQPMKRALALVSTPIGSRRRRVHGATGGCRDVFLARRRLAGVGSVRSRQQPERRGSQQRRRSQPADVAGSTIVRGKAHVGPQQLTGRGGKSEVIRRRRHRSVRAAAPWDRAESSGFQANCAYPSIRVLVEPCHGG